MLNTILMAGYLFALVQSLAAADRGLTAAEIADRNAAARGGLQAWRAVQALTETGKLAAGGDNRVPAYMQMAAKGPDGKPLPLSPRLAQEAQLPFRIDMERPQKVRIELQVAGKTAVQVYDGVNGWKLRPYLNRIEVEPFSDNELKLASLQSELDGPLIDYAAKGTQVELEGTDKVEGNNTYKLKLTMKDGHMVHVWIDTRTFLETKIEGAPRRLDGQEHRVEIYFRDYRRVQGLQVPFVLETKVVPLTLTSVGRGPSRTKEITYPSETIVIEKMQLNPNLDASLFSKPLITPDGARTAQTR